MSCLLDRQIYPRIKNQPAFPEGRGNVTLRVGSPIKFDKNTSYEEAANIMYNAVKNL